MIKYFCDLCKEQITDNKNHVLQCKDRWNPRDGFYSEHICPGCASVIMDTISKLRVDEP